MEDTYQYRKEMDDTAVQRKLNAEEERHRRLTKMVQMGVLDVEAAQQAKLRTEIPAASQRKHRFPAQHSVPHATHPSRGEYRVLIFKVFRGRGKFCMKKIFFPKWFLDSAISRSKHSADECEVEASTSGKRQRIDIEKISTHSEYAEHTDATEDDPCWPRSLPIAPQFSQRLYSYCHRRRMTE